MNDHENDEPERASLTAVGWREWVQLPELGLPWIKAKVDSGARTSALHAFSTEEYEEDGVHMVRFELHPLQRDNDLVRVCTAPVTDRRVVSDSGGHREERLVIRSLLCAGGVEWPIELTLTCRDNMKFRMLLGRTAMEERLLIDPGASFLLGRPPGGARRAYLGDANS